MKTCKNCGHNFNGNFCSNCGQSADTHRLDLHYLWHDIRHGLLHFDEGVLYSFRELYIRPGHSIREFVEGKRKGHFQPISLVVLLAVFYGLLYHSSGIDSTTFLDRSGAVIDYNKYNDWISTHFSWVALATIPIYTIGTQICFRNLGYNFVELLVLNTFKAAQRLFLHIATIPLLIIYDDDNLMLKKLAAILFLADVFLSVFTDQQFFVRVPTFKAVLRSLASQLIFLAVMFVLALIWLLLYTKM